MSLGSKFFYLELDKADGPWHLPTGQHAKRFLVIILLWKQADPADSQWLRSLFDVNCLSTIPTFWLNRLAVPSLGNDAYYSQVYQSADGFDSTDLPNEEENLLSEDDVDLSSQPEVDYYQPFLQVFNKDGLVYVAAFLKKNPTTLKWERASFEMRLWQQQLFINDRFSSHSWNSHEENPKLVREANSSKWGWTFCSCIDTWLLTTGKLKSRNELVNQILWLVENAKVCCHCVLFSGVVCTDRTTLVPSQCALIMRWRGTKEMNLKITCNRRPDSLISRIQSSRLSFIVVFSNKFPRLLGLIRAFSLIG